MSETTPVPAEPAEPAGPNTYNTYDRTLAKRYLEALAVGRAAYGEADEIVAKLHERNPPGTRIEMGEGIAIELVDNFAYANVAWKPAGVKRLDAVMHQPRKSKFPPKKSKTKP